MCGKREYGDYQTPAHFVEQVCAYLKTKKHIAPKVVIEPTCGVGNFLQGSRVFHADRYYGIEISPEYCDICRGRFADDRFSIINDDLFSYDIKSLLPAKTSALIIGNPPWVTNSSLSVLGSANVPEKLNFKGARGIDALTGTSNFDICEYIILKLIYSARNTDTAIAMLCKTTVARNVLKELTRNQIGFAYFEMLEFDAAKVFGISAQACVLVVGLSAAADTAKSCKVYSCSDWERPKYALDVVGNHLRTSVQRNYDFDGECCFAWRQGVKHDCSGVMELTMRDGVFCNKMGHAADIESAIVFPLAKSSTFKAPIVSTFSKYVLVTQKTLGQDTGYLQTLAPRTWKYLNEHKELFDQRKSSIYRGMPPFSMFGIGTYSYSRYKVGISGFYKKPLFSLLYSPDGRPVMTDDTSYYLSFDRYDTAYVAMLLLNARPVQEFLVSIAFLDAKRPYTKKVLERLSFQKITAAMPYEALRQTESILGLRPYVTEQMYRDFRDCLAFHENMQMKLVQIS